jgi:hypothetical protein
MGNRTVSLVLLVALVPVCWVLTFEGGFIVLPAAIALLVADAFSAGSSSSSARLVPNGQ